jgi:hypothetical protein
MNDLKLLEFQIKDIKKEILKVLEDLNKRINELEDKIK